MQRMHLINTENRCATRFIVLDSVLEVNWIFFLFRPFNQRQNTKSVTDHVNASQIKQLISVDTFLITGLAD